MATRKGLSPSHSTLVYGLTNKVKIPFSSIVINFHEYTENERYYLIILKMTTKKIFKFRFEFDSLPFLSYLTLNLFFNCHFSFFLKYLFVRLKLYRPNSENLIKFGFWLEQKVCEKKMKYIWSMCQVKTKKK